MRLDLTEEEVKELRTILWDDQMHTLDQLDKATQYQFHDEMSIRRKRLKVNKAIQERLGGRSIE